jgi:hypothetical protein
MSNIDRIPPDEYPLTGNRYLMGVIIAVSYCIS